MIGGFLIGGTVSEAYGWRAAMFAVGIPGLALAALMYFLLREPQRGGSGSAVVANTVQPGIKNSAVFMFKNTALRQLLIASTITGMGSYGASTWLPAFFVRVHDFSQAQVGLLMALLFGGLGAVGTLVGGKLFDVQSNKGPARGVWMIAIVQISVIPLYIAAYQVNAISFAIGLFLLPAFAGNFFLGPTLALIQSLSPVPMRAVAAAIKMFCLNLVGLSLGPFIVGFLSDVLQPEYQERSLPIALSVLALLSIWSAVHFWLCGKALQRAQLNTELTNERAAQW
jgi:predicted MFS family arabinose efflux permease